LAQILAGSPAILGIQIAEGWVRVVR